MHLIDIPLDEIKTIYADAINAPVNEVEKSLEVYLNNETKLEIHKLYSHIINHIIQDYKDEQLQVNLLISLIDAIIVASITASFTEFKKILYNDNKNT